MPLSRMILSKNFLRQMTNMSIDNKIDKLKSNQKLIMDSLGSNPQLTENDLKIVKWAYNQRFKMLQREKQRMLKK